jgi:hypothetical protein
MKTKVNSFGWLGLWRFVGNDLLTEFWNKWLLKLDTPKYPKNFAIMYS